VTAAWHDGNTNAHYLTVSTNFNVGGVTGTPGTIVGITPAGATTHFWNAADAGFNWPIDGLHIVP